MERKEQQQLFEARLLVACLQATLVAESRSLVALTLDDLLLTCAEQKQTDPFFVHASETAVHLRIGGLQLDNLLADQPYDFAVLLSGGGNTASNASGQEPLLHAELRLQPNWLPHAHLSCRPLVVRAEDRFLIAMLAVIQRLGCSPFERVERNKKKKKKKKARRRRRQEEEGKKKNKNKNKKKNKKIRKSRDEETICDQIKLEEEEEEEW